MILQKVRDFAESRHQFQKYGRVSYMVHLNNVSDLLAPFGKEMMIAGLLHDVLEDTDTTYEELVDNFGRQIANVVYWVTDKPGGSRKEKKADMCVRMSKLDVLYIEERMALILKVADRLSNVRCIDSDTPNVLKMYKREYPAFRAAVYRPDLCDSLWEELDSKLLQ